MKAARLFCSSLGWELGMGVRVCLFTGLKGARTECPLFRSTAWSWGWPAGGRVLCGGEASWALVPFVLQCSTELHTHSWAAAAAGQYGEHG